MSIYKKFDYTFLKKDSNTIGYLNMVANLYLCANKNIERKNKYPKIYAKLLKEAKFQSVKASNAIEGIYSTNESIHSIVDLNIVPLNHNDLEIAGYNDALNYIYTDYQKIDINENTILFLHKLLLGRVKPELAGKYKTVDNVIAKVDDGTKTIRYIPLPANEVQEAMVKMCEAYKIAISDSDINPLLLIPTFVLDFLCIHPFLDGNGRVSRLLSILLLLKNNFDVCKYVSFEKGIEIDKSRYYEYLYQSSINWDINENNPWLFIKHFNFILAKCYRFLDDLFVNISNTKGNKAYRIEQAILSNPTPISKKELSALLPDISISTIESVLAKLLKANTIKKIGSRKACLYTKQD